MKALQRHILVLMGTRPEVIKLAPLVMALRRIRGIRTTVCLSGQHAQMAGQMLAHFGLAPDDSFDVPRQVGNLTELLAGAAGGMARLFAADRPDCLVVQGDTSTAMLGAVAGFYERIPVAHVEAGLRSFDLGQPFPEEFNRRVISIGAGLHFCPTRLSADNLRREGVPAKKIHVVGNTCIDALMWTLQHTAPSAPLFTPGMRGILVTGHRRENWEAGLAGMCGVIARLVDRFPDVEVVYPVHPNPVVKTQVEKHLAGHERVRLLEPMAYGPFCHAMKEAGLIISDSGGVQEEALALGTPVLVTRNVTERPEVLDWPTVRLVGDSPVRLWNESRKLLQIPAAYKRAARPHFPFGRGASGCRIAEILAKHTFR